MKRHHSLGEMFKMQREGQGFDTRSMRLRSHIPEKYMTALEHGHFSELPKAKAHRLAYVRQYATILGLDPDECTTQFYRENGLEDVVAKVTIPQNSRAKTGKSISVIIKNIVVSSLVVLFAGYLIWQVKGIIEPPQLSILSPIDGSVVQDRTLLVEGQAAAGTNLTINGQTVAANTQGAFSIPIDLVPGLNTLTVNATKKHGKTTTRVVNVILKAALLPNNP